VLPSGKIRSKRAMMAILYGMDERQADEKYPPYRDNSWDRLKPGEVKSERQSIRMGTYETKFTQTAGGAEDQHRRKERIRERIREKREAKVSRAKSERVLAGRSGVRAEDRSPWYNEERSEGRETSAEERTREGIETIEELASAIEGIAKALGS